MFTVGVLTISDACFHGIREDSSGIRIVEALISPTYETKLRDIVPDELELIQARINEWSNLVNLILTTGGTGLGQRDVTPEATLSVIDRQVPGIAEVIREETRKITPMASLSRSIAGIIGQTLIINLPGSPKGVVECLNVILPILPHALTTLLGPTSIHPNSPKSGNAS
jgi:molybdopterin adenylyltransferase